MAAVRCPACGELDGRLLHRQTAADAAHHFVPRQRDPERHADLAVHLAALWGRDFVEVRICEACNFGYAVPWVGGDARFYELVHSGDPHYPGDRWEFGHTIEVLKRPEFKRPLRLLEVGAGHGAFLDRVRRLGRHEIVAADYDAGAVDRLRKKGYEAIPGSLADISGTFDVVCLFQTVEHMADLDAVFGHFRRLLAPGGSVFVSVPNGEATALQEEITGFWDTPPNHVGRWNPIAIKRASERRGFRAVAVETEPVHAGQVAWQLAVYSVNARSYTAGTVENRINAIENRPARGVLRRVLAATQFPRLLMMRRRFRPLTCWAQLCLPAPGAAGSPRTAGCVSTTPFHDALGAEPPRGGRRSRHVAMRLSGPVLDHEGLEFEHGREKGRRLSIDENRPAHAREALTTSLVLRLSCPAAPPIEATSGAAGFEP